MYIFYDSDTYLLQQAHPFIVDYFKTVIFQTVPYSRHLISAGRCRQYNLSQLYIYRCDAMLLKYFCHCNDAAAAHHIFDVYDGGIVCHCGSRIMQSLHSSLLTMTKIVIIG